MTCHNTYPLFFFTPPATTEIYTLSLHDALPISRPSSSPRARESLARWPAPARTTAERPDRRPSPPARPRSEEHTSELQSRGHLVCRLLLEKKNHKLHSTHIQTNSPDSFPSAYQS